MPALGRSWNAGACVLWTETLLGQLLPGAPWLPILRLFSSSEEEKWTTLCLVGPAVDPGSLETQAMITFAQFNLGEVKGAADGGLFPPLP